MLLNNQTENLGVRGAAPWRNAAQHRAALSANAEMILLYWDIGRLIAAAMQPDIERDLSGFTGHADEHEQGYRRDNDWVRVRFGGFENGIKL